MRRAIFAASSVGSASVSSIAFVCSDCVPPSAAAIAWYATRTMLLCGCCAVRETPAVCACVRSRRLRGSRAPYTSRMCRAQMRRPARNFAISSKKSLCTSQKKESRGAKLSTSSPRSMPRST